MTSIAKTALMAAFTTLVGWFAFARRGRGRGPLMLTALLAIVVMQPTPSQALEIRHDENAVSRPGRRNDRRHADRVRRNRRDQRRRDRRSSSQSGDASSIRGHVGGQVFAAAKSVTIDGEVDGSVLGVGTETLAIASTRIGRNVYGVGSTIEVSPACEDRTERARWRRARATRGLRRSRRVRRGAENVDVSGSIGGALTAYAEHIALRAPAHIAGNVTAHVARRSPHRVDRAR